jgi:hypothetical protein
VINVDAEGVEHDQRLIAEGVAREEGDHAADVRLAVSLKGRVVEGFL